MTAGFHGLRHADSCSDAKDTLPRGITSARAVHKHEVKPDSSSHTMTNMLPSTLMEKDIASKSVSSYKHMCSIEKRQQFFTPSRCVQQQPSAVRGLIQASKSSC